MSAAIILILTAGVAWYVLSPLWLEPAAPPARDTDERARLLDTREGLLRTLRDLTLDHATGKMSDADYETLRRRYEADAVDVLRRLDMLPQ